MLTRFTDPALRARIARETEAAMNARFGGASGVYLPRTKQELTTVMRDMQAGAGETVIRLLEQGSPGIIARFGIEADLVKILQHDTSSIACDCGAVARDATHPRYHGTYPRVLGRYVREQKALTWESAIRKMTGLPAATTGIVDRGLLAAGMAADVVVFDPATIIDHATFDEPTRSSDGVRFVFVNGSVAVRDGKPTGARAGLALRKTARMPIRPMNGIERRAVTHRVTSGPYRVVIDVTQARGARAATGTFTVTRPADGVALEMKEFGHLQTARDWASFTGRARVRRTQYEESVTVIVDGRQLFVSAGDLQFTADLPR
jgi:hypothetical protein